MQNISRYRKKTGITQPLKENTPVTHFFISSESMTGSQFFLLTPIHRLVRVLIYESRVFFLKSRKSRSSSLKKLNCLPSQLPLKCRCNAAKIWVNVFGRYGVQSSLLISTIFRCIQKFKTEFFFIFIYFTLKNRPLKNS